MRKNISTLYANCIPNNEEPIVTNSFLLQDLIRKEYQQQSGIELVSSGKCENTNRDYILKVCGKKIKANSTFVGKLNAKLALQKKSAIHARNCKRKFGINKSKKDLFLSMANIRLSKNSSKKNLPFQQKYHLEAITKPHGYGNINETETKSRTSSQIELRSDHNNWIGMIKKIDVKLINGPGDRFSTVKGRYSNDSLPSLKFIMERRNTMIANREFCGKFCFNENQRNYKELNIKYGKFNDHHKGIHTLNKREDISRISFRMSEIRNNDA